MKAVIDIGRVCVKTKGREAGKKAVIVDLTEQNNFAIIDGINVKRRKCNIRHLIPTIDKIDITKGAKTEEIKNLLK